MLVKKLSKIYNQDGGLYSDLYPDSTAVLFEKAYNGSLQLVQAALAQKESQGGLLTDAIEQMSKNISASRIIVGNYFGRLMQLWKAMKYIYVSEMRTVTT